MKYVQHKTALESGKVRTYEAHDAAVVDGEVELRVGRTL